MNEDHIVVFQLGREEYGIPIHQVKEIIRYTGATKLPNTPRHLEGIINLRGQIIPVIDLAARFAVNTAAGSRQALILELAGSHLGIVVDNVTEVRRLPANAIEAPPAQTTNREHIRGIGKVGERLIILLELAQLADVGEPPAVQAAG